MEVVDSVLETTTLLFDNMNYGGLRNSHKLVVIETVTFYENKRLEI